jgi:uncharacterized protein DUF3108
MEAGTRLKILAAILFLAAQVSAQAPPFVSGESTDYDISWRVFGAGRAKMSLVEVPGPPHQWKATVEANSTAFVSKLYQVSDIFRSTFQADSYCSEQLIKDIHEGKRNRDIRIDFHSDRKVAAIREMDLTANRQVRAQDNPIPACAFDVVSAIYYVRTVKLEVGKPFQVPINDGGHTLLIDVEVQAKEEIKTPAGVFKTIRIEPLVFGGQLFKKSGRMQIWLTDDASHRMVQLKARLFIGNITATATK